MPVNATVDTKSPDALVSLLRTHPHGIVPLICWRHGQIPALLDAFGVAPTKLLPGGKWPDDVYDWVLVLRMDARGEVASTELVHEDLIVH